MPDTTAVLEKDLSVSVVIPAHNAAETIAETLKSLLAQTYPNWEAIVVNDGSSDGTAAIATHFAKQDSRIRTVSQPQMGVCAARNIGVSLVQFDWLLFLDADDWISKEHLERMTSAIASDPNLDVVHCGWIRVAPDGTLVGEKHGPSLRDMFTELARYCPFAIHACIVRRSLVEAVGGFDVSLPTCEEWDLWQRIARTGASFGAVPDVLALYRMRQDSLSGDGTQFFTDGLRVLTQGHSFDPRVANPHPTHRDGLSPERLSSQRLHWASWPAGLVLGCGKDARHLLDALVDDRDPVLNPYCVAECIFESAPLPTCQPPTAWDTLWPTIEQYVDEFLLALEAQAQAPKLARRARRILERFVLQHSTVPGPLTIGTTHAVRVEVTESISDIHPPAIAERLHCTVELEGRNLGTIELPVCGGLVPSYVLADAIAAQFAWPILGRFFERTVYGKLSIEQQPTGLSLQRGSLTLANGLPEKDFWQPAHDHIGWTVFLQEIWAHPDWPSEHFYNPEVTGEEVERYCAKDGWMTIEVSENLPDVEVSTPELDIVLTVGGVALGTVTITAKENIVSAQQLRVALIMASGFELCRAGVREGLLGKPLTDATSLRTRLFVAATAAIKLPSWFAVPGSAQGIGALLHREQGVVLGQRTPQIFGTSASRRAMLPLGAARELMEVAAIGREPVVQVLQPGDHSRYVVYAPDIIWPSPLCSRVSSTGESKSGAIQAQPPTEAYHLRGHFEMAFAEQADPWKYTTPYEQTKYEQTLSLLPSGKVARVLELACAEGHFTVQLAPHVGHFLATDISHIALKRATERCAGQENIHFKQLDLTRDSLPGGFELIVCSEVLYYVGELEVLQAIARRIADALEPGGYFLTAHANLVVDEPDRTGYDWDHPFGAKVIGETFASTYPLQLVKELQTPLYRIQLFQSKRRTWFPLRRPPEIIELPQPTPPPPRVAETVLWNGGSPRRYSTTQVVTDRLPILMYHRVAPTGLSATAPYRVTPEAFEEQLRYLRDAGFRGVGLEEWQTAMAAKRPLPGRAVLITFDDGYLDFFTHAWSLLKRYGFSAIVFLVTDLIGKSNSWDYMYGEEVSLLGWKEIRQLRDEGVEFGSHSASHQPLTALLPEEVVREGARSRSLLERALGRPIKSFAYPYGDCDQAVQHLIGASGYTFGLTCRSGLSKMQDSLLALPRIEVTGSDNLQDFVTKLSS